MGYSSQSFISYSTEGNIKDLLTTEKNLFPLRKTNDNNQTWWKNYFAIPFLIASFLDGFYYYGFKFINLFFHNVLLDVYSHPICFHFRCHNFQLKRYLHGRLNIYMFLLTFWTQNTAENLFKLSYLLTLRPMSILARFQLTDFSPYQYGYYFSAFW